MKKRTVSLRFQMVCSFYAVAVCALVVFSGVAGCGKKALPLPPHAESVPRVTDLSHDIRDSQVMLTWTVPSAVKQGVFGEGEMILSRARIKLTDELCPECPLAFQRIARLPILRADNEPKPVYDEVVQQGFRYTYRVVLHMKSGRSSEASNLVVFDY